MNFLLYFPALETFAEKKLGAKSRALTTTSVMSAALGIEKQMVVGLYEYYRRHSEQNFEFEKEFGQNYDTYDWNVVITKAQSHEKQSAEPLPLIQPLR